MDTVAVSSLPRQNSWLSLVAETAGVADCGIARVHVFADSLTHGLLRTIVQVLDADGQVVGATEHFARAGELLEGVRLDFGFSAANLKRPLRLVAWLDHSGGVEEPHLVEAPAYATEVAYSERLAMKLTLSSATVYAA